MKLYTFNNEETGELIAQVRADDVNEAYEKVSHQDGIKGKTLMELDFYGEEIE